MEQEIWKDIPGYEGLYQVSNLGRIKSLPRYIKNQYGNKALILKQSIIMGYNCVNLYKDKKHKNGKVHRLVISSFIGLLEGYEINHKDGNKQNNNLENLEQITKSENHIHKFRILGYKHPKSKSVNQYDLEGNFIKTWDSINKASTFLGKKSTSNIILACKGVINQSYGFKWRYNLAIE